MIEIREVLASDEKSEICNKTLRALPEWFCSEKAIADYVSKVESMPFYVAYESEKAVGFIAIRNHNEYTAEVFVMGVAETYHRQGLGRRLIKRCEEHCISNKKLFLTVKTLDASAKYEPYDRTREFYKKMGFIPLEIFPMYWDTDNPCLFMVKAVLA